MLRNTYARELQKFPPFVESVRELSLESDFAHLTAYVTAPVLFSYVWYVLQEAERMGLKRLYFLARDGHILLEMAKIFSKHHPVNLELCYLYCSRHSLRMPSYHRLDTSEAMDLLLRRSASLSLSHVFDRIEASTEERASLCKELVIEDPDRYLSKSEFAELCARLKTSQAFKQLVKEKSRRAYETTLPYLVQEGLTDGTRFGIVDSGWTGSIQRTLHQLSEDIPSMTGFYFGMNFQPRSALDGVYNTWYFHANSPLSIRTKFVNTIFECLCSAPHAMTIGYVSDLRGRILPRLKEETRSDTLLKKIQQQQEVCLAFTRICVPRIHYSQFPHRLLHSMSVRLLQALMYTPTREEALALSDFTFCDDITESYEDTLVSTDYAALEEYRFFKRLQLRRQGKALRHELYWVYGTLACSPYRAKGFRRFSARAWDLLRCYVDAHSQP